MIFAVCTVLFPVLLFKFNIVNFIHGDLKIFLFKK